LIVNGLLQHQKNLKNYNKPAMKGSKFVAFEKIEPESDGKRFLPNYALK